MNNGKSIEILETHGEESTEGPVVLLGLEGADLEVAEGVLQGRSVHRVSRLAMLRQILRQQRPTIVITEIWMKDGHILEVVEALKEDQLPTVLVLVASSLDEDIIRQVMQSGRVTVLQRPLRALELASAVEQGLEYFRLKAEFVALETRYQKLMSQGEEGSRLKSEFLSLVSHELRTPLTEVIGYAELLRDGSGAGSVEEYGDFVSCILRSAYQLRSLIEDLVILSKAEAGTLVMEESSFPVFRLLEGPVGAILKSAGKKDITTEISIDKKAGFLVGDIGKLSKVLVNLISNAIKFGSDGGSIGVEVADAGEAVLFKVWDTGKGVKAERLQEIFKAFRQEDSSDQRRYGGLGIGLSIVKHFVALHGGSVRVTSDPEKRTIFSFVIPRKKIRKATVRHDRTIAARF